MPRLFIVKTNETQSGYEYIIFLSVEQDKENVQQYLFCIKTERWHKAKRNNGEMMVIVCLIIKLS